MGLPERTPHNAEDMRRHYKELLALQDSEAPLINVSDLSCRATRTFGPVEPTLEELKTIIGKVKELKKAIQEWQEQGGK